MADERTIDDNNRLAWPFALGIDLRDSGSSALRRAVKGIDHELQRRQADISASANPSLADPILAERLAPESIMAETSPPDAAGAKYTLAPERYLPRLGQTVLYRSRTGDYDLAALVVRTADSSSMAAMARSRDTDDPMRPLAATEVDLVVLTPGVDGHYREQAVPMWEPAQFSQTPRPRTWRPA